MLFIPQSRQQTATAAAQFEVLTSPTPPVFRPSRTPPSLKGSGAHSPTVATPAAQTTCNYSVFSGCLSSLDCTASSKSPSAGALLLCLRPGPPSPRLGYRLRCQTEIKIYSPKAVVRHIGGVPASVWRCWALSSAAGTMCGTTMCAALLYETCRWFFAWRCGGAQGFGMQEWKHTPNNSCRENDPCTLAGHRKVPQPDSY